MDGITDAAMRALMGELGGFSYAVSEFLRVSVAVLPAKVFRREVPELLSGARTPTGLPVQVQILGGDPDRMAASALAAVRAGANAIDINFGCPAPTVNRNDGGASLLRTPCRIRDVVRAVREAVPTEVPVSAKLRLGWESTDEILVNAPMAVEGGANWLTLHARTRMQSYRPPVDWAMVGRVRQMVQVPVVANGDIWNLEDFRRCREVTGCQHFMIGRAALANPRLPGQIARELGLNSASQLDSADWESLFRRLVKWCDQSPHTVLKLKQWIKLAHLHGDFPWFDRLKTATTLDEFFDLLSEQFLAKVG